MPTDLREQSSIETAVLGARFIIKNAASGTAFALFGAMVICVMLIQSSPSVSIDTMKSIHAAAAKTENTNDSLSENITLRGDSQNTIALLTQTGRDLEAKGDLSGAEAAYRSAVTAVAEPINDLAWIYLKSGRAKDSQGLAKIAVQLRPDEGRYKDTLDKANLASKP